MGREWDERIFILPRRHFELGPKLKDLARAPLAPWWGEGWGVAGVTANATLAFMQAKSCGGAKRHVPPPLCPRPTRGRGTRNQF